MNRKKALLLISAIEFLLLAIICVLFVEGVIKLATFIAIALVLGVVSSAAIIVIVRKLPPM